jgi:hypothetical protein
MDDQPVFPVDLSQLASAMSDVPYLMRIMRREAGQGKHDACLSAAPIGLPLL